QGVLGVVGEHALHVEAGGEALPVAQRAEHHEDDQGDQRALLLQDPADPAGGGRGGDGGPGGGGHDGSRRAQRARRCRNSATTMTTPVTICATSRGTPWAIRVFCSSRSITAPTTVPTTEIRPP